MKPVHWRPLWLSAAIGLAGCYGNTVPGSTSSIGSSAPIDTTLYAPPAKGPLTYRGRQPQLEQPLPARVKTDTNVAARIQTPRSATYVPAARPRPAASTLPATRRVQEATEQELQALSPVGKLPASPVPQTDVTSRTPVPASPPNNLSTTD
ncbi:hypothetical protein [Hymenobacter yonginensis]|uniref:Uncharacterized protein n=1 Tax=Hymenobacter yonginensis TaxID=748197 RepID=A0ABY7PNH2_9BACT|nr:hypothetical protein [Hymenobacter yonginensis]WBO84782.1 hypothetical protein O9Z63_00735 [Hymenobacter yonginensis]